jgi:alpha/beta hydrolase family protein
VPAILGLKCDHPPFSRIPYHFVLNAVTDLMVRWVKYNIQPSTAPEIERETGSTTLVARDKYGNALGGIRLPQHSVPTAVNTGVNTPGAPSFCRLAGSYQAFDEATLDALYPNHGAYVSQVVRSTLDDLLRGFLVPEDAVLTVQEAAHSDVGKP